MYFDLKSRVRIFNWPGLDRGLTLGVGRERQKGNNLPFSKKKSGLVCSSKGENTCWPASNKDLLGRGTAPC